MAKSIPSFQGGELDFLKLGLVLVDLSGSVSIFLESQHSQTAVFEVKCVFWHVDWN